MEPNSRFAKRDEFFQPKLITFVQLIRAKADELGSQFSDKAGFTNRVRFAEADGTERAVESTNFGLYRAFKDADLHPGDECLALTVNMVDPYNTERKYQSWIVQRVQKPEGVVDYGTEQQAAQAPAPAPAQSEEGFDWN